MLGALDAFRRGSMKHLMFKDWSLFERFHAGFSRERSPRAFLPAAHQFEVFLRTLVREVSKRSVLAGHPFRTCAGAGPAEERGAPGPGSIQLRRGRTRAPEGHLGFVSVSGGRRAYRQGKFVIIVDDEDRENEGDLCLAAEHVTPEAINFMAREGPGLICVPLTEERCDELRPPARWSSRTPRSYGTAFTVSVEARGKTTTGISAADRAATVRTLARPEDEAAGPPPARATSSRSARATGGVLKRAGPHRGVGRPRADRRAYAGRP